MTRINTNILSLAGQVGLQRSNSQLGVSLRRLSTGLRINTGKDDPAGLIASEVLRSEIVGINQAIANSERANSVIATADAALGEVSKLLNDIRGLIQSSANDGAISDAEVAANQTQLDSALDSIDRIGQITVFGGEKLLNGNKSFVVSATGGSLGAFSSTTDIDIQSFNPALHSSSLGDDVSITVTRAATQKSVEVKGTDLTSGNGVGLEDLSLGTSTRATTTLTGSDLILGNSLSLDDLSSASTRADRLIEGDAATGFGTLAGTGTDTVSFNVVGDLGTTSVTVTVASIQADSQALADAINAVTSSTGVVASTGGGALADVTIESMTMGSGGAADLVATAATVGADVAKFDTAAVAALTAGTDGAATTIEFTVTGDRGSATFVVANTDSIINDSQVLVDAINSRTDITGVTASLAAGTGINSTNTGADVLLTGTSVGTTSTSPTIVATTNSAAGDQTLINATATVTAAPGTDGTSNTVTLEIVGDLGRSVITINNDAVINDVSALANAINSVTEQTGVTATGTGHQGDVILTSQNFGSDAILSISAIAQSASGTADLTLFNSSSTQLSVNGTDTQGTITHAFVGGAAFSADGEAISYRDASITLEGLTTPSLVTRTTATTTVQDTTPGAGGLDSLTGTGTDTINFAVTGSRGTATITGVNVVDLQGDSSLLVNLINAQSITTGVTASLSGQDVVLSSQAPGATGNVSIVATAATQAADLTVFNATDTFTGTVAGSDTPLTTSFDVTGGALFQIGPIINFANQVNINIPSLDTNTLGRNISTTGSDALASVRTGGANELKNTTNLNTAGQIIDQAIIEIATLRGRLGALQKNVLESNISSLQSSFENVTAAESRIRDADFALETAALTRAQILVQAGTAVLSIANSNPQNVLALLG